MKDSQLHIRIESENLRVIEKAADMLNMSITDFVKVTTLDGAKAVLSGDPDAVKSYVSGTGRLFLSVVSQGAKVDDS